MDRRERNLLLLITVLALAVRVYFLAGFENIFSWEAEDYSKINLVNAWMQHGMPYPDPNFGPLHTWLIYLLTLPFADHVLPVRLFSLVCGAAAVPLFYFVARREVGRSGAMLAAALFAFYPVHVRSSATSLAEAPYSLAFFGGMLAFLVHRTRKDASYAWLALSAACFTIAGMLRFEAWLFYPALCLFALRRGLLSAVGYGAMLALFPAWHMYVCFKSTGNPLSFGATSAASFMLYLPQMPLAYRAAAWPAAFWQAMSPPLLLLGLAGLVWATFARKGGFLAAMFFPVYGFLSYRTLRGQIDPSLLRYSVVLAALLIPFAGGLLSASADKFIRRRSAAPAKAAVAAAFSVFLFSWSYAQAVENRLPPDVKSVALFLREKTNARDRIVLDKRFHPYFVVESRHNPDLLTTLAYKPGSIADKAEYEKLVRRFFPLSYGEGQEVDWGHDIKLYDEADFAKMMQEFDPTVLVLDYESGGNIQAFPIPPLEKEAVAGGRRFTRVMRSGDFAVFRIAREKETP